MDPDRRSLLLSLALAPLVPGAGLATEAPPPSWPLEAQAGGASPAPPFRYGGTPSSPVRRLPRDAPARISLRNALTRPTSLDLHGIRAAPPLGGTGPLGGAVAPGAAADFVFVPPDSGTFWFHPWVLDAALDGTAQGLAGVLVVEETTPPDVDADLVVLLTDRWPLLGAEAREADALRIDGGPWPRREVLRPGSRIRLRLVNGSTRRAVGATLSGAVPAVVAVDGQPSERFRPLGDGVPIGPGARFDLMFDLPGAEKAEARLLVGGPGRGEPALILATEGEPQRSREPIRPLPPNPLLPPAIPLEASTRATLVAERKGAAAGGSAGAWTINGVSGADLPKRPLFRARRGSPVTLAFRNASPDLVAFRLHGFAMRLLHDMDDGWEPYWRDSVLVPPGTTHHAAFVADLAGRWLVESPFFTQAAGGLRGWFEIT